MVSVVPLEVVDLLEAAPFQYAVTCGYGPHYYSQRKRWPGSQMAMERGWSAKDADEAFNWVLTEIRTRMVPSVYRNPKYGGSAPQHYFYLNGQQYFTHADPVEDTWWINRTPRVYTTGMFGLNEGNVPLYDDSWAPHDDLRTLHFEACKPRGAVLDIGCGTGALVDYQYRRLTPYLYRGIDPSAHALAWFGLKHAEYRHCLLRTSFEDYRPQRETPDRRQFDTVVAMFGVASMIDLPEDEFRARLLDLMAPGARAYLMYKDFRSGDPLGFTVVRLVNREGVLHDAPPL